MRIEDLKIFVDVVRYHSMNIAAEKNFTTPQNLSKIIKRMEDELGTTLLNRSRKGSVLTEKGETFYLNILEMLKMYENACDLLNNKREVELNRNEKSEKKIKILCTQGFLSYAVMDVYQSMKNGGKHIILEEDELTFYDTDSTVDYIEKKSFDIIACIIKWNEIEYFADIIQQYLLMHVFLDEMVLAVSKNNAVSNRSLISIKELNELSMIAYKDNVIFNDVFDFAFSYDLLTNSVSKALDLIGQSDMYGTLLSASLVKLEKKKHGSMTNLSMVRLREKMYCPYLILVQKDKLNDKMIMEFVKGLTEIFLESNIEQR